ncbi:MAG: tyrosine-type recombinase/integrase [bacterium]|nr:tyrosine-type recombinase/integrase [bacterium]
MTQRMRLSDRNVARLRAGGKEYMVWDSRTPGLGVRVRSSGYAAFVYLDNRGESSRRQTVGPVTTMTVEQARAVCRDLDGNSANVPAHSPTFRDFVEAVWKTERLARCKPSTRRRRNIALTTQLLPTFGHMRLGRISRKNVNRWFDRYSAQSPGGANYTLDLLRQIMNHAKLHGHVTTNPATGIRRNPRRKFNRFLSKAELSRLHDMLAVLEAERPSRRVWVDIIRLLLLTGCRCGEIVNLKWSEVAADALELVDSKTGPRKVYLNSEARFIIARQSRSGSVFVFPSPRDPSGPVGGTPDFWRRLRKRAGIEDVRLHDLRHTFASYAVMRGVPLPTVARLLGHRNVSMTLRYAHIADREVQAAAERVGAVIAGLCVGGLASEP